MICYDIICIRSDVHASGRATPTPNGIVICEPISINVYRVSPLAKKNTWKLCKTSRSYRTRDYLHSNTCRTYDVGGGSDGDGRLSCPPNLLLQAVTAVSVSML